MDAFLLNIIYTNTKIQTHLEQKTSSGLLYVIQYREFQDDSEFRPIEPAKIVIKLNDSWFFPSKRHNKIHKSILECCLTALIIAYLMEKELLEHAPVILTFLKKRRDEQFTAVKHEG